LEPILNGDPLTAPTKAQFQLTMMEEELETGMSRGVGAWLAEGIKIEEAQ
jgi:hypothetical protein